MWMKLEHKIENSLLMPWLQIPEYLTLAKPQEIDIKLSKMNIQL
jgi:hypothetical protein